jgi:uroporphyrinogen III methyltransferase / synthase
MANGKPAKVYLVGAGPGDPGLLTLRAADVLRSAEVLLYDALAADSIVALAPPQCERIFVGKRGGNHAMPQADIHEIMLARAREGRRVVRLKGGDPFVFGRGGEEAEVLYDAGIPFEIVAGITSAIAAPAYAGIPVTHRDYAASFTVVTGHEDPTKPASTLDWAKLADPNRTLVLLMAMENLAEIAAQLVANGLPSTTPAAIVQDGTRPTQRTVTATLATIAGEAAAAGFAAPAVVIVGGVTALRERLRWFENAPLFGKRVLVTRAGEQAEAFARALLERGAEPILAPTIALEPPDDTTAADRAVAGIASFAWIVFTSRNGVDAFFERLSALGRDARALHAAKIAAIGEGTAQRLATHGLHADCVPETYIGEEVARVVIDGSNPGDRILVYRAQEARDVLPRMLEGSGRIVTLVPAYKTVTPADPNFAAKAERANVLTFTSASTVRGFVTLIGGESAAAHAAAGKCVACIGPITARAATDAGIPVGVIAERYTTLALIDALEQHFSRTP